MTAVKEQPSQSASLRWPWRAKVSTRLRIVGIGGAMPLIYWLGIALPYPLAFGLAHPRGTWIKPGEGSFVTMALHISVYLLLTLLYVAALRLLTHATLDSPREYFSFGVRDLSGFWKPDRSAPNLQYTHSPRGRVGFIFLIWALCAFTLLLAAPNGESHDLYDYLFRGRMMDRLAVSPLVVTPDAFPQEPFYAYVAWIRHVDTYGPLWEYASAAVSRTVRVALAWTGSLHETLPDCPRSPASCQTLAAYVTGYRLLAILLTGCSGLLIYKLVRTTQPTYAVLAVATWLWNPLLLLSTAVGAHNDAIMLLLLLLTYWFWQREQWVAGWLAIGMAAQVKLTILLLVPALGLWLVGQLGWWRAIKGSLVAVVITLGVSWVLYAPLGGWATLPRMLAERQQFVAHSLAQILYFLLYKLWSWPRPLVWEIMVQWSTWLFIAVAGLFLLRTFMRTDAQTTQNQNSQSELYRTCALLMVLYLVVGSFWFQPWYLVWVLVPAALWVDGRFSRVGLPWGCFGALSSNVLYTHLTQLPIAAEPDAHLYRLGVTVLVVMSIWVPLWVAQGVGSRFGDLREGLMDEG